MEFVILGVILFLAALIICSVILEMNSNIIEDWSIPVREPRSPDEWLEATYPYISIKDATVEELEYLSQQYNEYISGVHLMTPGEWLNKVYPCINMHEITVKEHTELCDEYDAYIKEASNVYK